ncbi:hypothetical protein D3C81_1746140 [compost metagenome]
MPNPASPISTNTIGHCCPASPRPNATTIPVANITSRMLRVFNLGSKIDKGIAQAMNTALTVTVP